MTLASSTPFKLMDDVKSVSLGMNESSVIKEDGSLWAWGSNAYGQIGASQDNYQTNVVTTPIKVMDNVSKAAIFGRAGAAVTTDGNLWMWGDDLSKRGQSGENPTIKKMTSSNVLDVSFIAGQAALMTGTVAMIKSDNSLWTWGYNGHNQTGTGLDGLYIEEPVNITGLFTETEQTDLNLARTALVANQHEAGLPDTAIPVTSIEDSGEGLVSVVVEGLEAGETYNLYAVKNYNEENRQKVENIIKEVLKTKKSFDLHIKTFINMINILKGVQYTIILDKAYINGRITDIINMLIKNIQEACNNLKLNYEEYEKYITKEIGGIEFTSDND